MSIDTELLSDNVILTLRLNYDREMWILNRKETS
jgi:hypothetical protein